MDRRRFAHPLARGGSDVSIQTKVNSKFLHLKIVFVSDLRINLVYVSCVTNLRVVCNFVKDELINIRGEKVVAVAY